MQSLIELSRVLLRFASETFFKAKAAFSLELPLQRLPQANYQGNKTFNGIALSVVKFVSETLSR